MEKKHEGINNGEEEKKQKHVIICMIYDCLYKKSLSVK